MQQILNGELLNLVVEGIRHGDSLAEGSEPRSWAAPPRVPTNNHHRLGPTLHFPSKRGQDALAPRSRWRLTGRYTTELLYNSSVV